MKHANHIFCLIFKLRNTKFSEKSHLCRERRNVSNYTMETAKVNVKQVAITKTITPMGGADRIQSCRTSLQEPPGRRGLSPVRMMPTKIHTHKNTFPAKGLWSVIILPWIKVKMIPNSWGNKENQDVRTETSIKHQTLNLILPHKASVCVTKQGQHKTYPQCTCFLQKTFSCYMDAFHIKVLRFY